MLKVWRKRGAHVEEGSLADLGAKETTWIDIYRPSKAEIEEISKRTDIGIHDLNECLDPAERPKLFDIGNYSVIIFACPLREESIRTAPVTILVSSKNDIITIHSKEFESFARIRKKIENVKRFENSMVFLRRLLDEVVNDYFSILDYIEDEIDLLEDFAFKKHEKMTYEKIFFIKKALIYFHKSLVANREVITGIEKEYLSRISRKEARRFREIYNDIIQLIDTEETFRDILTGVLDIYLSSVSNNLNMAMKRLTVYASFILVPTLISGIYGMNFQYMPELYWRWGYVFALMLMLFSIIMLYIYFRARRWI